VAKPTGRPLRDEIVTAASELIQRVGVSAFSYGTLAEQLGIKAPSIHHHFRTREDLIVETARRYREQFAVSTAAIDATGTVERLRAFAALFERTASQGRFCLCGAVAAEWALVGEGARDEVHRFLDEQIAWIEGELRHGVITRELRDNVEVRAIARTLIAALEGAMLLSRAGRPVTIIPETVDVLIAPLLRR
jgi:TetR/AcrR family transcriptional regulator, transcriptional repressor for nem operon